MMMGRRVEDKDEEEEGFIDGSRRHDGGAMVKAEELFPTSSPDSLPSADIG